jgi:quercetin dioxygenase-like cupin family protein
MPDFCFSPNDRAEWQTAGLRGFMQYRDLGVTAASNGIARAQHIRISDPTAAQTGWHRHELTFQLVYVLRGWVKFTVQGGEEIELKGNDSGILPGGVGHDETDFSDDFEVLLVNLPAAMKTEAIAPQFDLPPLRPCVVSREHGDAYIAGAGTRDFLRYRDLGALAATDGDVGAKVLRAGGACDTGTGWYHHTLDLQFVYLLDGAVSVDVDGHGSFRMRPGDAMTLPGGLRNNASGFSADFRLLEVSVPGIFATVAG